jgi:hypothetical protein
MLKHWVLMWVLVHPGQLMMTHSCGKLCGFIHFYITYRWCLLYIDRHVICVMFKCQKGLLPNQLKPYNSVVIIHGCDG